jgi:plastocyanin
MRSRAIGFGAAGLLLAVASVASELAGAQAPTPTVTAHDYYFQAPDGSRTPASVTIASGGAVSFGYPAGLSQHDVHFTSGLAPPSCSGGNAASQAAFDSSGHSATPQGPGWSGTCTFSAPGDYSFRCTLHPSVMYGTVHVAASAGGSSPPSSGSGTAPPPAPTAPTAAPAVSAVAVPGVQHGSAVAGTVTLGNDGSRLVVGVYAAHSLLAVAHSVRVGQTLATGLPAGRHNFRVALNGAARRALHRHRRLALKVRLSVIAGSQPAAVVTRHLTLTA